MIRRRRREWCLEVSIRPSETTTKVLNSSRVFNVFITVVAPGPSKRVPDTNFWQDDINQRSHFLIHHYQNLRFDRVEFAFFEIALLVYSI